MGAEVGSEEERKNRVAKGCGAVKGMGEEGGWVQRELDRETQLSDRVLRAGMM